MKTIKLMMPASIAKRIKHLQKHTGAKDFTHLLRKMLHLFDYVVEADEKGLELWTVNPLIREDGTDRDGLIERIVIETESDDVRTT